jgi:hypothetical protein
MSGAFAAAMAALHADGNIGCDAAYRRPPGAWIDVRVVLTSPNDMVPGLAGLGTRAGSITATLLATDATPVRGDELRLGSVVHRVEDAARDAIGISWRLTLVPT